MVVWWCGGVVDIPRDAPTMKTDLPAWVALVRGEIAG